MAGSSKKRGNIEVDEERIKTAGTLARIEAKLDVFKENQLRHEAADLEITRQTNLRLERIETRGEERNKELTSELRTQITKLSETVATELASFSTKLNGVSEKQSFFAGGRAVIAQWITTGVALLIGVINFFKH